MWILFFKTLFSLAPFIIEMIKEGKIKEATRNEVMEIFETEFAARRDKRVAAAVDARGAAARVPDAGSDPNDRANKRRTD